MNKWMTQSVLTHLRTHPCLDTYHVLCHPCTLQQTLVISSEFVYFKRQALYFTQKFLRHFSFVFWTKISQMTLNVYVSSAFPFKIYAVPDNDQAWSEHTIQSYDDGVTREMLPICTVPGLVPLSLNKNNMISPEDSSSCEYMCSVTTGRVLLNISDVSHWSRHVGIV